MRFESEALFAEPQRTPVAYESRNVHEVAVERFEEARFLGQRALLNIDLSGNITVSEELL